MAEVDVFSYTIIHKIYILYDSTKKMTAHIEQSSIDFLFLSHQIYNFAFRPCNT